MKTKAKKEAKKVTKKRQPKPKTLRSILNGLDAVLNGPDKILSRQLWDVLTALRGPDTKEAAHHEVKQSTTAVIRKIAFPKTASDNQNIIPAVFGDDSLTSLETRRDGLVTDYSGVKRSMDKVTSWHFEYHAKKAFYALGLNWLQIN